MSDKRPTEATIDELRATDQEGGVVILGIDPGLGGAVALCGVEPKFHVTIIFDMPTHTISVNGAKKRVLDLYGLARWIDIHSGKITKAVIEDPHALPGQGVTSSFNFGFACGVAQMLTASALIPMHLVRPATWKKAMGLTSDKDASRRRASMLFPQHAALWSRAKDDGRAEAVLLAYYGSKLNH